MSGSLRYVCDDLRHLICVPYTVENMHVMAKDLNIKKCWFHNSPNMPHYDIPKRRIDEIKSRCTVTSGRGVIRIAKTKTLSPGQLVCSKYSNIWTLKQASLDPDAEPARSGFKLTLTQVACVVADDFHIGIDHAEYMLQILHDGHLSWVVRNWVDII